jgi:hypothetical protein
VEYLRLDAPEDLCKLTITCAVNIVDLHGCSRYGQFGGTSNDKGIQLQMERRIRRTLMLEL